MESAPDLKSVCMRHKATKFKFSASRQQNPETHSTPVSKQARETVLSQSRGSWENFGGKTRVRCCCLGFFSLQVPKARCIKVFFGHINQNKNASHVYKLMITHLQSCFPTGEGTGHSGRQKGA